MAKQTDKKDNYFKPFVTRWILTDTFDISLPLTPLGIYDFDVDWGDGTSNAVTGYSDHNILHTYATTGIKTVTIIGLMTHIDIDYDAISTNYLDSIIHFGYTGLINADYILTGALNLKYYENNPTWSRSVTSMHSSLNSTTGDISKWDVSNVTMMNNTFGGSGFNADISTWDVSNVTTFITAFAYNFTFNQPLNNWNVSNVTDMTSMFLVTSSFNQPLNDWDTSKVTNMSNMFNLATSFNQDISTWDFSSIPASSGALTAFIDYTAMSGTNYDKLLIKLDLTGTNAVVLGAAGVTRTAASATAHANLISKGWTITDGGQI